MRDIRDVYYGFTSEVFRRREAAAALSSVKEWHCFSLQLPDRTLDFAAPTDQEAVAWTICLRTLCYCQVISRIEYFGDMYLRVCRVNVC